MLFWNEPILKLWLFSPYLLQCTFRLPSANLSDTNTLLLCFIPVCPAEVPLLRDTLISFSCTLSTELFVKNHSQNISKAKERITVMESTIRDLEAMQEYLRIRFGKKKYLWLMSILEKEPSRIMKNWIRKRARRDYLQTKQVCNAFMEIY